MSETSQDPTATSTAQSPHGPLLGPGDPPPVRWINRGGASPFLLAVDHAGLSVPARLGDLGLPGNERRRHIGWDIGAAGLAERLSARLDAPAVLQNYSRLVIDCNRRPGHRGSIIAVSDGTAVPANAAVSAADRAAREREIFQPYQDAIAAFLDERAAADRPAVLVAVHSFTPVMAGIPRPWHAGVLFNRDDRLARPLLDALRAEPDLPCDANEPYRLSDADDHTVPVHGENRGLLHVELEIRQDLLADAAGEERWAALLSRLLPPALRAAAP